MMRSLAISVLVALWPAGATAERTFGLAIGIDQYTYIPDLHGAVNDAEDIADALRTLGADVTLLTNGAATRSAILAAWEDILRRSSPGDRFIVSYAGHGSNEPEHLPGSERDGRDENFLLAGYAPHGASAGERIRDDEIADLLARSAALDVIFVADACHAGTVTRDLKPALGYRYVTPENMTADPLPPPPPPPPGGGEGQMQVALFLAAVNESEKVPEFLIDGTPRGALSYAFAGGLRGAADLDGDGVLTKGEIEAHVRRTVREVSDGVQRPQAEPAGRENISLIPLPNRPAPPAPDTIPLVQRAFAALPAIVVQDATQWAGITGISFATPGRLRREGPAIYSSVGDRIAMAADPATLQAVVDKHRLVDALNRIAVSPASIGFDQGDLTYPDGEVLEIRVDGRSTSQLTLVNIGADGTVSLLYPQPQFGDPPSAPPNQPIALPVVVTAPYGADHVIAIETDVGADELRRDLEDLSGTRDMAALWDVLRSSGGRFALFPFFTAGPSL